jgi:uncharacterized protein (TIGR03118 family)
MGGATHQDANLVNPWGLTRGSTTPWWVANNGMGTATLYDGSGVAQPPATPRVVVIPPASGSDPGVPTGAVFFKGMSGFEVEAGKPALFLFVTEDGTVSGWNPTQSDPSHAIIKVTTPGAVYKGAAIASRDGAWFLYATNFAKGRIEVFDSSFHAVSVSGGGDHNLNDRDEGEQDEHGRFQDHRIPRGFSPFGIQDIGGDLYVTFAKRDPATNDDVKGPGLGYVDVFSPSGRLLRRFEHGPWLNAPWGLSLAPSDFGVFSHNLLVGQFGSGEIAAYDAATGAFLGKVLKDTGSDVLTIDGLWALGFGNGGAAGPANTLFFTAGLNDEADGLFGTLTAVGAEQVLGSGK